MQLLQIDDQLREIGLSSAETVDFKNMLDAAVAHRREHWETESAGGPGVLGVRVGGTRPRVRHPARLRRHAQGLDLEPMAGRRGRSTGVPSAGARRRQAARHARFLLPGLLWVGLEVPARRPVGERACGQMRLHRPSP